MLGLLILLVVVAVLGFWVVGIYNGLIRSRRGYENAFAQIDVQLTRRYDLIPNLVETAKAYMKHEAGTLEAVIAARNSAMNGLKAAQAHPGDGARHPGRLQRVVPRRLARVDVAEAAAAGAGVAEDHERGGAVAKAFANVRAVRALAHGVELRGLHQPFQLAVFRPVGGFGFDPIRAHHEITNYELGGRLPQAVCSRMQPGLHSLSVVPE